MQTRHPLVIAAVLAGAVACATGGCGDGCSNDRDLGGADSGAPVDADAGFTGERPQAVVEFEQFTDDLAETTCAKLFECCDPEARQKLGVDSSDPEACSQSGGIGREFGFQLFKDGLREGGVAFDQGLAELCLESIREADCSQFHGRHQIFENRTFRGCAEALEPTRPPGETCENHASCQTGYCKPGGETEADLCRPPPEAGESCEQLVCATDHWCDTSVQPSVCRSKNSDGESCTGDRTCRSGRCVDGTCQSADAICRSGSSG